MDPLEFGNLFRILDFNRDAKIDSVELDFYKDNKKLFAKVQNVLNQNKKNDGSRRLQSNSNISEVSHEDECEGRDCDRRLQSSDAMDVAEQWMQQIDTDNDGVIEWGEFMDFFGDSIEDAHLLLRGLDIYNDHRLNIDELTTGLDNYTRLAKALKVFKRKMRKNDGNNDNRRLDDFDEDQLNDGLH